MTPLTITQNQNEENYNAAHKRTRRFIETAFGVLKARFTCLSSGIRMKPEAAANVINACVILHNLIVRHQMQQEEMFQNEEEEEQTQNDENTEDVGSTARARGIGRRMRLLAEFNRLAGIRNDART